MLKKSFREKKFGLKILTYKIFFENISKNWATAYEGNHFDNGNIVKLELEDNEPQGNQAFIFNLRNKKLQ